MIEMLENSWKSLVNAGNKSHHLTTSPSHHLCNFREIVDNGVGASFHETLLRTVAVRNADGHAVGVATHENVEVGVAYDDGVLGLQIVVLQRLYHRLGVGLCVAHVLGSHDERYDVVELERAHEVDSRLISAACSDGHYASLCVQQSHRVSHVWEHRHANLAVHVLEYLTVLGCTLRSLLLVHRLEHGERLHVPYKNGFYNVGKFKDAQSLHFAVGYPF